MPALNRYSFYRSEQAIKEFRVQATILEEQLSPTSLYPPVYNYKISVKSNSNKNFDDVPTRISIGFLTNHQPVDFETALSPFANIFKNISISKNPMILEGSMELDSSVIHNNKELAEYPIKVQLYFQVKDAYERSTYYLEPNPEIQKKIKSQLGIIN